MRTDDLLDRPDSFEARLCTGLDHIAAADPVADPGVFDPDTLTLATIERHDRTRRLAPALVAASVAALTIGGLTVIATRDNPPGASNQPTPGVAESDGPCDDRGCSNFDPLPLAPGAATYYRSSAAAALGVESIHPDHFERLTRCAELAADDATCARIEGIAGVALVEYVAPDGSTVEIGTTFTTIGPAQYADRWGPTVGGGVVSPVVVRGHDAVRYWNEAREAVVWRESSGVLVWVAVDPASGDDLLEIAESVEPADAADVPTTIPHRVVVPGLGESWMAMNNNGDGVVVALHDGVECVGFGFVDRCGTAIGDRIVVDAQGDAWRVSGSTPSEVVKVRVSTSGEVGAEAETVAFAPYASRFFSVFVGAGDSLAVEWIDADGDVVDVVDVTHLVDAHIAGPDTLPPATTSLPPSSGGIVLAVVDASDTPGAGDAVAADLRRRGYSVVSVERSARPFQESMLMPRGSSSDDSSQLLEVLGIGGFDTWTPSLIEGTLPATVTDVLVLGAGGLPSMTPPSGGSTDTTVP